MFIVVCQHVYQKYFIKDSSSLPKRRREDFEQYLNNADIIGPESQQFNQPIKT